MDSYAHQTLHGYLNTNVPYYIQRGDSPTAFSFDTTNKRTAAHSASLKLTGPATAAQTNFYSTMVTSGNYQVLSFYFRINGIPSSSWVFWSCLGPSSTNVSIQAQTSTGYLVFQLSGGGSQTYSTNVCDGNWHRIDYKFDCSGTTFYLDAQVDGNAITQVSKGTVTAGVPGYTGPGTTASLGSYAVAWYQDVVCSGTPGDYPIGDHIVKGVMVSGDGTHNLGGIIADQGNGTTNLYQACDDAPGWDNTYAGNTDFVKQTNGGAGNGNYAEFTITDPSESTVWDVSVHVLLGTTASSANSFQAIHLVSGSDEITLFSPSDFSNNTTYFASIKPRDPGRPTGGWDGTKLAGVKVRWGYSTDATPNPQVAALMVEYATPWSGSANYTRTHTTDAVVLKSATRTHTVDAVVLKSATRTHTTDAVVLKTITPAHTTDAVVLKTILPVHAVDAVVHKTIASTHTVDAYVVPLLAPQNLVATPSGTSVDVTWDAVTGAAGYDIERDGAVIVWRHGTNSYTDGPLSPGTCTYRARAVR